jgi:hypothetical protein
LAARSQHDLREVFAVGDVRGVEEHALGAEARAQRLAQRAGGRVRVAAPVADEEPGRLEHGWGTCTATLAADVAVDNPAERID